MQPHIVQIAEMRAVVEPDDPVAQRRVKAATIGVRDQKIIQRVQHRDFRIVAQRGFDRPQTGAAAEFFAGDLFTEPFPVFRQDERITYLIPELAFEYKNRFAGDIRLGEVLAVRFASADPVTMSCRMLVK